MTRISRRSGRRALAALCLSLACSLPLAPSAGAVGGGVAIQYQAIDLQDERAGEDRWLYRYAVGHFDHGAEHGFSILFDPARYSALTLAGVAVTPAGWDAIALQPDPLLPADGLFDALAIGAPSGWSGPFEVAFVWNGSGEPGEQAFVVYDERFATIETGLTIVPEPAVGALFLLGLSFIAFRRRASAAR